MKASIVGFTGSQIGWQYVQKETTCTLLTELQPYYAVHGGCIGADDEFDKLCVELGIERIVWPSNIVEKSIPEEMLRARGGKLTYMVPAPPLIRNKRIVDCVVHMIACPKELYEVLRSGTWATIRYAKKHHVPIDIVYPTIVR